MTPDQFSAFLGGFVGGVMGSYCVLWVKWKRWKK